MQEISRSQPAYGRRLRLQFAETPSWRALETLSKLCRNSGERVGLHYRGVETVERKTSRDDVVDRLHQQLQDSLQELVTSENWQRELAVAARFHNYSFASTRLIWAQSAAPGFASNRVAGYRAWQKLGRHARKEERGLQILAPVIRKMTPDNGEEEERRVVGFRVVHVSDIAQTRLPRREQ